MWAHLYTFLPLLCRRLVKYNPDIARSSIKEIVTTSAPSLDALRSFTVKNTLSLYQVGDGVGGEEEAPSPYHAGISEPMGGPSWDSTSFG